MEKEIKRFCKSHDMKDFDKLNEKTKRIFLNIINTSVRVIPSLATIIKNHFRSKPLPKMGFLSGITSGFKMTNEEKSVFLLGDAHAQPPCDGIEIYVLKFLNFLSKLDRIVDIFIEAPHWRPEFSVSNWKEDTYMGTFSKEVKLCMEIAQQNVPDPKAFDLCKYKNLRIHESDIRFLEKIYTVKGVKILEPYTALTKFYQVYWTIFYWGYFSKQKIYMSDVNFIMDTDFSEENLEDILNSEQTKIIMKQINAIEDVTMKKFLRHELKKHIKNAMKGIFIIQKYFRNYEKIITKFVNGKISNQTYTVMDKIYVKTKKYALSSTKFTDLFILGRMFRKFDKIRGNILNDPCKYSIVIAGDAHTFSIVEYLKLFGFKVVKRLDSVDSEKACIDFDELFN